MAPANINRESLRDALLEIKDANTEDLGTKKVLLSERGIGYAQGCIDVCESLMQLFQLEEQNAS